MANLRSLINLIVCASMVMVQPITAKRLLAPAAADESSKQTFDAQKFKSLLCHFLELKFMHHSDSSSYKGDWLEHICPSMTSTNGAKAGKVAKSIKTSTAKSSKSKSGKSMTTTTSTAPVTTTTTTSCPTEIVTSGDDLMTPIPDADPINPGEVQVIIPVELEEGCGCIVDNVAITIGINHTNVGDLFMLLVSAAGTQVNLVKEPPSDANLVASNLITFDDSTLAKDPQTIGDTDPIPADTYNAQGSFSPPPNATYPDPTGLGLFNGTALPSEGNWTFTVFDSFADNIGTVESVELTITCE